MEMTIIFGLMYVAFTLKWLLFIAHYLLWKWVLDLNKKNKFFDTSSLSIHVKIFPNELQNLAAYAIRVK